eukprot:TRINITY_DN7714_c0_g1_i1.p4 TRINITY_DN7714_c0_g1~~TRINITY_DN7714_c0_g1_i1.p4  ORF type:complete len:111 (+),score=17.20 TRINITY_DN7714_c0_g1_i1:128-460(+)
MCIRDRYQRRVHGLFKLENGKRVSISLEKGENVNFYYEKTTKDIKSVSFNFDKQYGSGTLEIIRGELGTKVEESLNFDKICKKNKLQCVQIPLPSRIPSYHVDLSEFPNV